MPESFICNLCPRNCSAQRNINKAYGFCGCTSIPIVAAARLHYWEEPCISGKKGSGTVFFSSCNLRCVFCQNDDFSKRNIGKPMRPEKLAGLFLALQEKGAANINLVTPTPHVYAIMEALDLIKGKLTIPVVYNTSGYEKKETIKLLKGYVDIFLTDYKYYSDEAAVKYSGASDYRSFASDALKTMIQICPEPLMNDDGMMRSGIIVRHLVLPRLSHDSVNVINEVKRIADENSGKVLISVMSQYTPNSSETLPKELRRKITTMEYDRVCAHAKELQFDGYFQSKDSSENGYVPEIGEMPDIGSFR